MSNKNSIKDVYNLWLLSQPSKRTLCSKKPPKKILMNRNKMYKRKLEKHGDYELIEDK